MTQAQDFADRFSNTSDLMDALDAAGIPSDQDWDNESTAWTFDDLSQIVVSGSEVQLKGELPLLQEIISDLLDEHGYKNVLAAIAQELDDVTNDLAILGDDDRESIETLAGNLNDLIKRSF